MSSTIGSLTTTLATARAEIQRVIIGQTEAIDLALITLLTRQHALIEGVPGVAKTLLVRTLAHVLGVPSGRIQFTPDLMPSDITGTNIFHVQRGEFELVRGPVFTTFLLADEINRAPAKTQAALLQAMQERLVTIDRETLSLDPNFTVFATQNPADSEGTYPLPEAQKDRFFVTIRMSPPNRTDELDLVRRSLGDNAPQAVLQSGAIQPVLAPGQLAAVREGLSAILVREDLVSYAVDLVRATRQHESVMVGAGPRASLALIAGARAAAALAGRDYVTPDDVRSLAGPVLGHRIVLRPEFELEGLTLDELVSRLLAEVPVPR